MLALSVLGEMSAAILMTVSITVLSCWFYRRRAFTSGVCMGGSKSNDSASDLS